MPLTPQRLHRRLDPRYIHNKKNGPGMYGVYGRERENNIQPLESRGEEAASGNEGGSEVWIGS